MIQQRQWSFKTKYDISCPVGDFYAEKKFFSLLDKVTIFNSEGTLMASVRGYFSFFKVKQDFIIGDNVFRLRTEKFWKGVFSCRSDYEEYKLLRHKGRNYSIFHNGFQIASFTKGAISFGSGDVYNAKSNSNVNLILVLCLILSVDIRENKNDDNHTTVTIDLGNIGPEEKPFDLLWKPHD